MERRRSTCPYCGVGCGVEVQVENNRIIALEGDTAHSANAGRLCIKGNKLAEASLAESRRPLPTIGNRTVDWHSAVQVVAQILQSTIRDNGPGAVAFYLSGQLLTEDYYVANKLMKGFIGSANVDTNSRLCMASAVAGHKKAFGEDVVPCSYDDLEECDLLVLCGSNAAWTHPVVYQRIQAAKQTRGTTIVVIDPRVTATAEIADLHLRIAPDSDVALFNGLFSYLLRNNHQDAEFVEQHTEHFAAAKSVNQLSLEQTALLTQIDPSVLERFYRLFAITDRTVTMFSQGVNQSAQGTNKVSAIINCHLVTGRLGKPGTGPFSITGQPNAMGGREVGGLANQLAAHMNFDTQGIECVGRFWNSSNIALQPGLKAIDLFDAVYDGRIKAVWIMGTNPAVSMPNSNRVREALRRCPNVIVSDCVNDTDTTKFANVLLPAAGWGEKDGTVTNSERVISRQRQLVKPAGAAKPDWKIVTEVAQAMGFGEAFDYQNPAQIFREHAALSGFENNGERLFDISGLAQISDAEYENLTPQAWPSSRPFVTGQYPTLNGRARFVATEVRATLQLPTEDFPLILNTGRTRDQWHTMSKTGYVPGLMQHACEPTVLVNPEDAQAQAWEDGALLELSSREGSSYFVARLSADTAPGTVFAPIHWSDQFASHSVVSQLFHSVGDPDSGQPESKHGAVRARRVPVVGWARAILQDDQIAWLTASREDMFWFRTPTSFGWCYDIASFTESNLVSRLGGEVSAKYEIGGQIKRAIGSCAKGEWFVHFAEQRSALPSSDAMLSMLESKDQPWLRLVEPSGSTDDSRLVCSCFEVRLSSIEQAISAGAESTDQLGKLLSCGTNCGSCAPELERILRERTTDKDHAA